MKSKAIRILAILVIIAANISCDQVSKNIVRDRIGYNETIPVIARHFTLTKVENTGAFLSLGDSLPGPVKTILLFVVPLLALVYGLFYLFTKKNLSPVMLTAICFLVGGGLGNIFDRALYGSVTDFLHIDFGLFQTGIFNMADVSVMVGVFTILLYSYFHKEPAGDPGVPS